MIFRCHFLKEKVWAVEVDKKANKNIVYIQYNNTVFYILHIHTHTRVYVCVVSQGKLHLKN